MVRSGRRRRPKILVFGVYKGRIEKKVARRRRAKKSEVFGGIQRQNAPQAAQNRPNLLKILKSELDPGNPPPLVKSRFEHKGGVFGSEPE